MQRLLILVLFYVVLVPVTRAHEVTAPANIKDFQLEKVSRHIYVIHGPQALPSPQTRGFMNNPGVILTPHGVIVVDPGSSTEIAKELLKKVRAVSDKPVIAVFNTHVHGDHWLGNHAVRELYPKAPIYAHTRMIERVNSGEGEDWIKLFGRMTQGAVTGTKVVAPNIGLKGGERLIVDGIALQIYHAGHAHTDHDLMIEVVEDHSMFCGDVVTANRVPNSDVPQDANFKGTASAIKTMLSGHAQLFIPGHGRSGGREVPEASLRFLNKLLFSVTKYYNQGLVDYEMKDKVVDDLVEYKDWNNFDEMGRVISYVYQEVERDNF
jgi:glyoxylase-like metal-dependent hydrolase (beta-lactamase superfamily II)